MLGNLSSLSRELIIQGSVMVRYLPISISYNFRRALISSICFLPLGFNFGEAANIATPEWLRVARDAAIRRASINYPPMVSHFQLLYDLALELCSRYDSCLW